MHSPRFYSIYYIESRILLNCPIPLTRSLQFHLFVLNSNRVALIVSNFEINSSRSWSSFYIPNLTPRVFDSHREPTSRPRIWCLALPRFLGDFVLVLNVKMLSYSKVTFNGSF
jgi:hypothetical protein